nr:hypothetical protein BAU18_08470 [Enterococcus diestrammenae]
MLKLLILGSIFVIGYLFGGTKVDSVNQSNDQISFTETVLNKNYNLVFYKKDCPYCKAARSTVEEESQNSDYKTFWINLDTQEGQLLKERYGVKYASTIVTLRKGINQEYSYALKKKGRVVPNRVEIEKAFKNNVD